MSTLLSLVLLAALHVTAPPTAALAPDAPVTHGPRGVPEVALTFDADMTQGMHQKLLTGSVKSFDNAAVRRILDATHTPATFFLTGLWTEIYPDAARQIARDPLFEVEDHSFDHPGFTQPCYHLPSVPGGDERAEITRAQAAISRITGVTPHYFRFPGGCAGPHELALVQSLGLQTVHWDVISGDADQKNPAVIVRNVLSGVQDGSIVIMHCHGGPHAPATALALPAILKGLSARGFHFVTVNQLLHRQP